MARLDWAKVRAENLSRAKRIKSDDGVRAAIAGRLNGKTKRQIVGDHVVLAGRILRCTAKAVHFTDGDRLVWLPLSAVSVAKDSALDDFGGCTVSVPIWLAEAERLMPGNRGT